MRIALCDFDEAYLEALLAHLVCKSRAEFFLYTSVEDLLAPVMMEGASFDFGIIGEDFLEEFNLRIDSADSMQLRSLDLQLVMGKIIGLYVDDESELQKQVNYSVYKYGPMENLLNYMNGDTSRRNIGGIANRKNYMIFSPTRHELTEIFALSFCQMLSEEEAVLLVDFSTINSLFTLLNREISSSLIDVVYLIESQDQCNLNDFLEYYSNIAIFPVARSPFDLNQLSEEQLEGLVRRILELDFDRLVFLVDDTGQAFKILAKYSDQLLLLNKKGDFYKSTIEGFAKILEQELHCNKIQNIELPMSASNLTSGSYQLEELIRGRLGQFVRSGQY